MRWYMVTLSFDAWLHGFARYTSKTNLPFGHLNQCPWVRPIAFTTISLSLSEMPNGETFFKAASRFNISSSVSLLNGWLPISFTIALSSLMDNSSRWAPVFSASRREYKRALNKYDRRWSSNFASRSCWSLTTLNHLRMTSDTGWRDCKMYSISSFPMRPFSRSFLSFVESWFRFSSRSIWFSKTFSCWSDKLECFSLPLIRDMASTSAMDLSSFFSSLAVSTKISSALPRILLFASSISAKVFLITFPYLKLLLIATLHFGHPFSCTDFLLSSLSHCIQ